MHKSWYQIIQSSTPTSGYIAKRNHVEGIFAFSCFFSIVQKAKIWNQSKCLLMNERTKKMWYTMEYYSNLHKKRKEILFFCVCDKVDQPREHYAI